jgi:hypothetical protein
LSGFSVNPIGDLAFEDVVGAAGQRDRPGRDRRHEEVGGNAGLDEPDLVAGPDERAQVGARRRDERVSVRGRERERRRERDPAVRPDDVDAGSVHDQRVRRESRAGIDDEVGGELAGRGGQVDAGGVDDAGHGLLLTAG